MKPIRSSIALFICVALSLGSLVGCKKVYVPPPPANQLSNSNYQSAVKYAFDSFQLEKDSIPTKADFQAELPGVLKAVQINTTVQSNITAAVNTFLTGNTPSDATSPCNTGSYTITGSVADTLSISFSDCELMDISFNSYTINDTVSLKRLTPDSGYDEAYQLTASLDSQWSDCLGCGAETRSFSKASADVVKQFASTQYQETLLGTSVTELKQQQVINYVAKTPKLISKVSLSDTSSNQYSTLDATDPSCAGCMMRETNQILKITEDSNTKIKGISRISTSQALYFANPASSEFPLGGSIKIEGANNTAIDIVYAADGSTVSVRLNGVLKQQFSSQADFANWRDQ